MLAQLAFKFLYVAGGSEHRRQMTTCRLAGDTDLVGVECMERTPS
jgi:hypothetical protein